MTQQTSRITVRDTQPVAVVTVANAARRNAFDAALLEEFVGAVEAVASHPDCGVVIVRAQGEHFCAGWNTGDFAGLSGDADPALALLAGYELLDRLWRVPAVTLGAVRGTVAGFGVGLLDRLHLAIGSSTTRIVLPEAAFGIAAGGVLVDLQRVLPPKAALDLLLGAEAVDAPRALTLGLVSRVVADEDLDRTVDALAARIAAHPGHVATTVLDSFRRSQHAPRDEAVRIAAASAAASILGLAGR